MRLKSRHQKFSVTVGDVTHTVELDQAEEGWCVGDVEPDVGAKCVAVSPGEYQVVEEERPSVGTPPPPQPVAPADKARRRA